MDGNYEVKVKKAASKTISKAPEYVQVLFNRLLLDLKKTGPIQPDWKNFSQLSKNKYHCHLNYDWVACWENEKGTIKIEVYYAGSREGAPY